MVKRCRTTHKIIHASTQEACKVLVSMKRKNPSLKIEEFNIYECPYCKGIHLGHKRKKKMTFMPGIPYNIEDLKPIIKKERKDEKSN